MKNSKITVLALALVWLVACSDDDLPAPINTWPTISDQFFSIEEDAAVGTSLGPVVASDTDGDQLAYHIVSGNTDSTFSINNATGVITLIRALDFDVTNVYSLVVGVADSETTSSAIVTINVIKAFERGLLDETIQHDNLEREYLLYVPESYTGLEAVPVVFSLHGAGGTKESQYTLSGFNLLADDENFILVTPEATAAFGNLSFWNQQSDPSRADDVGFINALIDSIANRYNIDLNRIYLAGSSNGAFMALQITCELSDKIAATAAVKGYMTPDQINTCNPTTPTAIIQMHGTEDPLVSYDGVQATIQFWNAVNQTNTTPITSTRQDTDPTNGNTTNSYLYMNGTNGIQVEHLEVVNGVHDWFGEPGTNYDINASKEAWLFFDRFDLNGLR